MSKDRQSSQSHDSTPKSTITQIDANVLTDDYLKEWPTIVAFVQKGLSVEQFSVPNHFHRLNHIFDDKTLDSTFLSDENSDALFVITGRQNANIYDENDIQVNHRFRRAAKAAKNDDLKRLVSVKSCLFYFTRSLTVTYTTSEPYWQTIDTKFDSIPKPVSDESKCWEGKEPAVLDLTYTKLDTTLKLTLTIANKKGGYWRVTKGSAFIQTSKSSDEFTLDVNEITAGDKFSYSCSQLKIASKNTSNSAQIRLKFSEFQLQPFENPVNKKIVFTSSESCEVWMTLPLWMGLITLSLLTVILLLGLYLLYRVATPDRFENPKGKPLIVAAADEQ
ncbi:unnamed protein product [Medioppia subpectinata]|uniref:Uncharacterized protein n=1 Tax=Medioppia subpectinata TaxID=1979941 RepID=A0A7R9KVR4_9ACAR|nr:unnamed protein product [Medioppia subpectinata]CAG2109580.1 unnamed protein product [Medioppia subpectinata]